MFSLRRSASPLIIEAQRVVYGCLPARDRGYELLGHTPPGQGCLVTEVIAACRRYGQPPSAHTSRPAWFALRLPAGPWAVVTVEPQGADDQGRPGALLFDAAVVAEAQMAATGYNVAAFVPSSETARWSTTEIPASLTNLRFEVDHLPSGRSSQTELGNPKVAAIVTAISRGQRVALEAEGPINDLVPTVWAQLPERIRRRSSVATWAFGAENRFSLMAVPRLAGVALDSSYLPPEALLSRAPKAPAEPRGPIPPRPVPSRSLQSPGAVAVGLGGLILVGVLGWIWSSRPPQRPTLLPPAADGTTGNPVEESAPVVDLTPAARASAVRGLLELAERFDGFDLGDPGDPATFLSRCTDRLHYRGPLLDEADLRRLHAAASGSPDAARALRWDEQVRALRDDLPWPGRFADLTLGEQLRALGRSFRLDPATPPEAVPDALIARLARSEAIGSSALGADFPVLGSYARFLTRLPRRDESAEPRPADR